MFGVAEPEEDASHQRDLFRGQPIADAVKKVGVIGLGAMGSGIAQVCITAGLEVTGIEVNPEALEAGRTRIRRNLDGAVKRGKMDEARKEETLARLGGSTDLGELADCDLIIEVIVENLGAKLELFEKLGENRERRRRHRFEHLVSLRDRHGGEDEGPRARGGPSLLQPALRDAARRSDRGRPDGARDHRVRNRVLQPHRQDADSRQGQAGIPW